MMDDFGDAGDFIEKKDAKASEEGLTDEAHEIHEAHEARETHEAHETHIASGRDGSMKAEERTEQKQNRKSGKKKRTAKQYAIMFFVKIGITALVVFLLLYFVVGVYANHSNSGYPMIKDGDLCLTFKFASLYKGDAIAYERDGETKFGRIVAEAGDVVDIGEEGLTVNGYGVIDDTVYPTTAEGATISFPYTVPQDTVFVLNDYRSDANDSRVYGAIPIRDTKGKVILVIRKRGI